MDERRERSTKERDGGGGKAGKKQAAQRREKEKESPHQVSPPLHSLCSLVENGINKWRRGRGCGYETGEGTGFRKGDRAGAVAIQI